jgi:large subunit ribosomal protein L10
MALTKQQKHTVVSDIADLLSQSKLTVVANYKGLTVKQMQELRKSAKQNNTVVKVVKNRLVKQSLGQVDSLKGVETGNLTEQLLYAFNSEDEVAPAQSLNTFAKKNPDLTFVGAITAEGSFISADDVKALANLPSKDQLRGQLVGTIAAPLTSFMRVIQGGQRGVLYALQARAETL